MTNSTSTLSAAHVYALNRLSPATEADALGAIGREGGYRRRARQPNAC